MPFTFSAGSFSFLKSSTTSQPNIKQNNNVDNVNKNNNNVNDNLDMGKTPLAYPPLNNNVNVIPLERRVRSLDNSISSRNNRRNSNASNQKNTTNRKVWYKSIFVRLHNTISRWNDEINNNDENDDSSDSSNSNNNNNNNNNTIENNNNNFGDDGLVAETENLSGCDDGPIMMKSRSNIVAGDQENSFIYHGIHHDFYVVTKNGSIKNAHIKDGSDGPLKPSHSSPNFNGDEFKRIISSSVFEECAKTPRHSKEAEVLGKVGRFTIVREREDFDTTYFDQCHCQQKPCRFSKNGCSGSHPVLPPELFKENDDLQIRISQQQAALIAHHQMQMANSTSKSRRSFYGNNTPSNSSRNSLPSLQKYNNGVCPLPIMVTKASTPTNPNPNPNSISNYCRVVLPHSSSSPNLVHLNQRSRFECAQNRNISNNNGRPNANIIVGGNSGKYPNPPTDNGSYYPQKCNNNNNNNNNNNINMTKKPKKSSLVNMKTTEEQQRRLSMPPASTSTTPTLNLNSSSTPSTPTTPSKFSLHPPNEPHTTINSHSGRKFEVEWNTTTKSSSSGSSSSSSSSETAYSPPSTISSVFSMASSPDKKSSVSTLSRRCSTLSSKCGRKFEVTILSSSSSPSNNCILNTSPHSTISVNSIVSSTVDANMEPTKC